MGLRAWPVVASICHAPTLYAQGLACRVAALSDGDTFTCLGAGKTQGNG